MYHVVQLKIRFGQAGYEWQPDNFAHVRLKFQQMLLLTLSKPASLGDEWSEITLLRRCSCHVKEWAAHTNLAHINKW